VAAQGSGSYRATFDAEAPDFRGAYVDLRVTATDANVAASGDSGFTAASFPAVFGSVVAVGGTTLTADETTPRGWPESAWTYGGSGCSAYVSKPK
jgi:hypothetical protein